MDFTLKINSVKNANIHALPVKMLLNAYLVVGILNLDMKLHMKKVVNVSMDILVKIFNVSAAELPVKRVQMS